MNTIFSHHSYILTRLSAHFFLIWQHCISWKRKSNQYYPITVFTPNAWTKFGYRAFAPILFNPFVNSMIQKLQFIHVSIWIGSFLWSKLSCSIYILVNQFCIKLFPTKELLCNIYSIALIIGYIAHWIYYMDQTKSSVSWEFR